MRVNIYAEEISDDIEIVEKTTQDGTFTGVRFYLYLPVTLPCDDRGFMPEPPDVRGKFMHHQDDDDSSAVTFWGKQDLRNVLRSALQLLDERAGE